MARTRSLALVAVTASLLVTGCGDGEETATVDPATDTTVADDGSTDDGSTDDGGAEDAAADGEQDGALCRVLADIDLAAAFSGTLTFGASSARDDTGCTVRIEGAEGDGLLVATSIAEQYDAKLDMAEQVDMPVSRPDLGQEAVLIGNGDLTVLVDGDTSLFVGLSAFFADGEVPPDEVLQQGLIEVARGVLDGM